MINFRWPSTKQNGLVPWFTVLRRTIFIGPFYILRVLIVAVAFMAWGGRGAKRTWDDLR